MIDLSASTKELPAWLLVCNVDYAQHTWAVQNYPYYRLFESHEEGIQHIQEENRSEPGFFPQGSWQLWYGVWSQDRICRVAEALQDVARLIY